MITLDVQLIELEQRWREADDMVRSAQAELAANKRMSSAQQLAVTARIEQAERLKKSIIAKIEALEESSLVD